MDFSKLNLIRLTPEQEIKPFDCGDCDLNDFLFQDAKNYFNELYAVTYLLENKNNTVAFFSVLNDKISFEDTKKSKSSWELFKNTIAGEKSLSSYPAMKIGRLGVSKEFKMQGIGTYILDYLKILFITNNRTGCRCITVDAYNKSLEFYKKNEFKYLTYKDEKKDTRLMYFDLNKVIYNQ